jgi:hypothetical protein
MNQSQLAVRNNLFQSSFTPGGFLIAFCHFGLAFVVRSSELNFNDIMVSHIGWCLDLESGMSQFASLAFLFVGLLGYV